MKFITNLFKPKKEPKKESKKEYNKVPEPTEIEPKANWIAKAEGVESIDVKYKAIGLLHNIMIVCNGGLRPNQDDCPQSILYNYKKLFELGADEEITFATNILRTHLSEEQQKDLVNKVSQFKEYKEWKVNKRIKEIEEDFK